MHTIDTLKLKLPFDVCSPVLSKLDRITSTSTSGTTETYYHAKNVLTGFKYIRCTPALHEVIIELSAKILQDDYKRLISLDTIEQVANRLTDTGIVSIKVADLIECGNVLKIDYCSNLHVEDVDTFLTAVNAISTPAFTKKPYISKSKVQSVIFTGNLKTVKERLTCYNKLIESKDIQFTGVLRIERNITDLKTIRSVTGYGNNLTDCLIVKSNPVLMLFDKIIQQNKISYQFMNKVLSKDVDLLTGLKFDMLLNECNNDMQTAIAMLKMHYSKSTAHRYIKQLEQHQLNRLKETNCRDCIKSIQTLLQYQHLQHVENDYLN